MDTLLAYVVLAVTGLALTFVDPARGDLVPEVLLDDLHSPCGIAIQPETGHVFVAESGSGSVVRFADGQRQEVVVGFPRDAWGQHPTLHVGPLNLTFLSREILVIGGGGQPAGQDRIYVVSLPAGGPLPLQADSALKLGPLTGVQNNFGQGDFYAAARTPTALFLSSQGVGEPSWIVALPLRQPEQLNSPAGYGSPTRFLRPESCGSDNVASALTISPRGELLVGQMGDPIAEPDSRLTFYRLPDGERLLALGTGLYDLISLTYGAPQASTDNRHLYALDAAWQAPQLGGLYRLDAQLEDHRLTIRPARLAALEHPTAMVLAPDGTLYVTLLGEDYEVQDQAKGKLVRFSPGL